MVFLLKAPKRDSNRRVEAAEIDKDEAFENKVNLFDSEMAERTLMLLNTYGKKKSWFASAKQVFWIVLKRQVNNKKRLSGRRGRFLVTGK